MFCRKDMGSSQTLVCVKQVKQEATEKWGEDMPLPGDIIEGFAEDDSDDLFVPVKGKSDFSSQLGKISQQAEAIWVKVRRGDSTHRLRVRVVLEKSSMLSRKFTIGDATDERHIAVLGDLTLEQCSELQEISRRVVNTDCRGFSKRGVKYDWRLKVGTYLPDQQSTVICSILFMRLQGEYSLEATTARCMAWFSAAISSGAPLVFVNIQTEQIMASKGDFTGREISWGRQRSSALMVQGIRLWFLPGVSEILLEVMPEPGEARFGMDIKRTEEGLIFVYSVTKGSAADRAGLSHLHEEANATGHLLVLSRLEGKSLVPSSVSSAGLINCCDHNEIRNTLTSAIEQMDPIQLYIMAWPSQMRLGTLEVMGAAALRPSRS